MIHKIFCSYNSENLPGIAFTTNITIWSENMDITLSVFYMFFYQYLYFTPIPLRLILVVVLPPLPILLPTQFLLISYGHFPLLFTQLQLPPLSNDLRYLFLFILILFLHLFDAVTFILNCVNA